MPHGRVLFLQWLLWDHCSTVTAESCRIANSTLLELQDQLPKTWRRNAGGIVSDSVCFSDYTDKCYTRDQLANHFSQIPALNIHNSPYR